MNVEIHIAFVTVGMFRMFIDFAKIKVTNLQSDAASCLCSKTDIHQFHDGRVVPSHESSNQQSLNYRTELEELNIPIIYYKYAIKTQRQTG